jgi:hypothetical protein
MHLICIHLSSSLIAGCRPVPSSSSESSEIILKRNPLASRRFTANVRYDPPKVTRESLTDCGNTYSGCSKPLARDCRRNDPMPRTSQSVRRSTPFMISPVAARTALPLPGENQSVELPMCYVPPSGFSFAFSCRGIHNCVSFFVASTCGRLYVRIAIYI